MTEESPQIRQAVVARVKKHRNILVTAWSTALVIGLIIATLYFLGVDVPSFLYLVMAASFLVVIPIELRLNRLLKAAKQQLAGTREYDELRKIMKKRME